MKEIPLTKRYVALIDDEDYERIGAMKWYACEVKTPNSMLVYARRGWRTNGRQHTATMHNAILQTKSKIDHRDGNGLNNQRSSLRLATYSQNTWNSRKFRKATSHYKGVSWNQSEKKWAAQVVAHGKHHWIGWFKDEVDAATAYNFVVAEVQGEFAVMNTPLGYSR